MDEAALIEKLRRIEALFGGATTDGERAAAGYARDRVQERLRAVEREDPPIEYQFSIHDPWERKAFMALLRRYDIRPFRCKRQRRTTIMARVSSRFVDETLWPQHLQLVAELRNYLSDITDRVIGQAIHGDSSDADVVKSLPNKG